jgi:bifunctional non-homologous end joining protein LigD
MRPHYVIASSLRRALANREAHSERFDSLTLARYVQRMSTFVELHRRVKRSASFQPCLPRPAKTPPSGPDWLHEIKHDGFRIVARKEGERVRLITRNGYDFTDRYSLIVDAIRSLPGRSCILDGEAIVVDQDGLSVFDLLRYRRHDHAATLCAFDLIELDGTDLRRHPIEERKERLAALLRRRHFGITLNVAYAGDGETIYRHACALGCEGIVSKRAGSVYRMGRTEAWIKVKNPTSPAVRREREIDWSKR